MSTPRPIRRLLIANRGEPVVRIARTCRVLGITSLALVTEDQQRDWWQRHAQVDERWQLHGTYLDGEAVLRETVRAGADAIHPGWGYLAENAAFARSVEDAGLIWVGPPPEAMKRLGDKAAARALAGELGLPLLPGYDGADQADSTLVAAAERIGYPVLLKPSAGGGGKGMHVAREGAEMAESLARARREARAAFGDEQLIVEHYLERPRHVEVQVIFDAHGAGVHLGERDCSLQRRHQKVIEEAPSPAVDPELRERLGEAAVRFAAAGGYVGAGTVEFLLAEDGSFSFMEMNTRLQVEHPVTELVTGRDLVADQLRIAQGEPLGFTQADVRLEGHAIEARIYAEDPWNDFLPAVGRLGAGVSWPTGPGIRVDRGVEDDDQIGTRYDPMLAKVLAHAETRPAALERLGEALDATLLIGITSNRGFLRWLLSLDEVRTGDARTDTIERRWMPDPTVPEAAWGTAASHLAMFLRDRHQQTAMGFRLNAPSTLRIRLGDEERSMPLGDVPTPLLSQVPLDADWDMPYVTVDVGGRALRFDLVAPPTVEEAVRHASRAADGGAQAVTAPMPGTVLSVAVVEGQAVEAHQTLVVLEAMKMENAVAAPADGTVQRVLVRAGQQVQRGEALVELA